MGCKAGNQDIFGFVHSDVSKFCIAIKDTTIINIQ